MIETITIVSDANPEITDAIPVLVACGVIAFDETASMGEPALVAHIDHSKHAEVVTALNRAGFRIIEGGQL